MPSRRSKKDTPAKLAGRMKRRWRVVLPRAKGEILGRSRRQMWRQPGRPRRSSLIWMKSSATKSWCRSLAGMPGLRVLLLVQYFLNQTLLQSLRQNLAHQVG